MRRGTRFDMPGGDGEVCPSRTKSEELWWRSAVILTCKSIVKLGYRGKRLIEPSSSWFQP